MIGPRIRSRPSPCLRARQQVAQIDQRNLVCATVDDRATQVHEHGAAAVAGGGRMSQSTMATMATMAGGWGEGKVVEKHYFYMIFEMPSKQYR